MANVTQTNIDNTSLIVEACQYRDVEFAAVADTTYVRGTVIAFNSATSKFVLYVSGGATGIGTPVSALVDDLTTDASGDAPLRMLQDGTLRADLLIVNADLPTVGVSDQAILNSLQDHNISTVFSNERSFYDNAV